MDLTSARIQNFFPSAKKLLSLIWQTPFWIKLSTLIAVMILFWTTSCTMLFNRHQQLNSFSEEVSTLCSRAQALEKQQELYKKMEEQIAKAPKDYLKQSIESIPLLKEEKQRVVALAKQFPDNVPLKERLLFLESDQNQIRFEALHGKEYHLNHRVQMDLGDLKKFLEAVEGDRYDANQKKPFLLMKKLDLIKCYEKGDEKVYSVYAELIQK